MVELLLLLVFVGVALIPWLKWPVRRVVETDPLGYVMETNVFGFFFYTRNLSDRRNKLEGEIRELEGKIKSKKKSLEDEEKLLKDTRKLVNDEHMLFLKQWAGKRHWAYLFRKVPRPKDSFLNPPARLTVNATPSKRLTRFSLDDLPIEFQSINGKKVRTWVFNDGPKGRNQQSNNQQQGKKKGGQQIVLQTTDNNQSN